jgi:anion-transporting  ArsA/GET3 family ATPase
MVPAVSATLLDKQLILVVGKGGVGRSTVAAALAAACAKRGRKTLLYETNANDRFAELLGGPKVGTEIVPQRENLWAVNTTPAAALEEYGLMVLKFRRVYQMVFENRVTKYFLRAIPGLDDYALLGKAWFHTTEAVRGRPRFDTLVFDMPASGHSLSMLTIPRVILETVPEGPLTRDARTLQALLTDRARTAVVLTTLAEEMPAVEARELGAALAALGLPLTRLIVNQVYADHIPVGSSSEAVLARLRGAADPDLAALAAHGETARARRRLNERYLAELARAIAAPRTELPLLFAPRLGPAELGRLSALLDQAG